MKVWITKYALTEGIKSIDDAKDIGDGYVSRDGKTFGSWDERRHFYGGNDWHLTEDAAIAHAEKMRTAKIASLRKSIAKIEALSFQRSAAL
jgi:hypothetical protein